MTYCLLKQKEPSAKKNQNFGRNFNQVLNSQQTEQEDLIFNILVSLTFLYSQQTEYEDIYIFWSLLPGFTWSMMLPTSSVRVYIWIFNIGFTNNISLCFLRAHIIHVGAWNKSNRLTYMVQTLGLMTCPPIGRYLYLSLMVKEVPIFKDNAYIM